ncbi:hypothetical protein ACFFJY_01335 [Fictibacillus aquaticus]|uniref:Uncharacterized protein n=1 Tax=Fictibacillus aquaticus TaxID=2021314 RepID=A0A235F7S6_9BACL|nr:hypothetical protein [Fictibacillus aquaticus]OYD57360.1 hypothetical protein CGZ90_11810 [Fictibacillus aquaticus]
MEMYTFIVWIVLAAGQVAMAALRSYAVPGIGQAMPEQFGTLSPENQNAVLHKRAVSLQFHNKNDGNPVFREVCLVDTS